MASFVNKPGIGSGALRTFQIWGKCSEDSSPAPSTIPTISAPTPTTSVPAPSPTATSPAPTVTVPSGVPSAVLSAARQLSTVPQYLEEGGGQYHGHRQRSVPWTCEEVSIMDM